jgi:hypothetical protein
MGAPSTQHSYAYQASTPKRIDAAVRASESRIAVKKDRVLVHGVLVNIRLFHILELLIIIHDEIGRATFRARYDKDGQFAAIAAYILRAFCSHWNAENSRDDKNRARGTAMLEDPRCDKQVQGSALRIARKFLRQWSTPTCPDLSNWRDMHSWAHYKHLTLRSWPMVRCASSVAYIPFHRTHHITGSPIPFSAPPLATPFKLRTKSFIS